jgi:hypothetical protein
MTTRKLSTQISYPFVPELGAFEQAIARGIIDVYFIIQGDPDVIVVAGDSSSSSSSAPCPDEVPYIDLVSYADAGSDTIFTFKAVYGESIYYLTFTVPNDTSGLQLGRVSDDGTSDATGVLVFNAADIISGSSGDLDMRVEPARAQWHIEKVDSLEFLNISRCAGVEDPTVELPVLAAGASSSAPIDIEDGYNCSVAYEDGLLTFNGQLGGGLGISPDLGDTDACGSSSAPADLLDFVSTINGLSPVNGNIVVNTSTGLGKRREPGRLVIFKRLS